MLTRLREAMMPYTLAGHHRYTRTPARHFSRVADDPLGASRGIIAGALLSLIVFWLPLAIALAR